MRSFLQRWMLDGNIWQRWAKNTVSGFPIALVIETLFHFKALLSHHFPCEEALFFSVTMSIFLGLSFAFRYHRPKNTFPKSL